MTKYLRLLNSFVLIITFTTGAVAHSVEVTSGQVVTDSNGAKSKTDTYKFDKESDNDFMSSVTMIAVGVAASSLYKYKPTTDVMIAGAGGLIYVVGEVKSTMDFKEITKSQEVTVTYDSDGKPNEEQLEKLNKVRDSYENAKAAADTKSKMQLAASAAFFTAAGTSILAKSSEMMALQACEAALTSAVTTCPEVSPAIGTAQASLSTFIAERETNKPSMVGHKTALIGKATLITNIKAASAAATAIATAECSTGVGCVKGAACAKAAAEVNICDSVPVTLEHSEAYGVMGSISSNSNAQKLINQRVAYEKEYLKKNHSTFYKIVSFLISEAEAGYVSLLAGGGGVAGGLILSTFTTYGAYIDTQMLTPMKRAIAWGSIGALSMLSANSSRKVAEKMQTNVDTLNTIVNKMKSSESGAPDSVARTAGIDLSGAVLDKKNYSISEDPMVYTNCISGNQTNNCSSSEDKTTSIDGFSKLPDALKIMAKDSLKVGDSLSGKNSITGAQLNAAAQLGNKAISAKSNLDKIKKFYNEQAKKIAKSPIDFEKNENALLKGFHNVGSNHISSKGSTPGQLLASINGGGLEGIPSKETPSKAPITMVKGAKAPDAGAAKVEKKSEEYKFNFGDPSALLADTTKEDDISKAEYDMGETTIHKDNGQSIFELISNRYLRSGYPRLLEVEEAKK